MSKKNIYKLLSEYFRDEFGERLQKVSVDAGFTCPNRDGNVAIGGCSYCNNLAFNPSYCSPKKSIKQQIIEGIEFHSRRYRRAQSFLAYFQPYSNTYGSVKFLKKMYDEALSVDKIVGITVSTRPDCFNEDVAKLLSDIAKTKIVFLEIGIESVRNNTLNYINRGHNFESTKNALKIAKKHNLFVTGHYIIGLPCESREDILQDTSILNELPINAIKLHQLQIIRNTAMEIDFKKNPQNYDLFELHEYVDFVVQFVKLLRTDIFIDRFAGEVPPKYLCAPDWGFIRYDEILRLIEKRFLDV